MEKVWITNRLCFAKYMPSMGLEAYKMPAALQSLLTKPVSAASCSISEVKIIKS